MTRLISTAAFDLAGAAGLLCARSRRAGSSLELDRNDLAARCESPAERASLETRGSAAAAAGLTIVAAASMADFVTDAGLRTDAARPASPPRLGVGQLAVASPESDAAIFATGIWNRIDSSRFRRAADWAAAAGLVVGLETGPVCRRLSRHAAYLGGRRASRLADQLRRREVSVAQHRERRRVEAPARAASVIRDPADDFDIGVYNAGGARSQPASATARWDKAARWLGRWRQWSKAPATTAPGAPLTPGGGRASNRICRPASGCCETRAGCRQTI